jgi:uncharacterized protein YjbI with pentapeptide repeats
MSNAVFTGGDLSNGVFRYVDFAGAHFGNVTAYNTDFTGSYFVGADFTGLNVVSTDIAVKMLNTPSDDESDDDSTPLTADDLASADPEDVALCTGTTFCNAIMPDGTKCTDDLSVWTDPNSGQVFACGCNLSNGTSSSDAAAG